MPYRRFGLAALVAIAFALASAHPPAQAQRPLAEHSPHDEAGYAHREDVQRFAADVAERHGLHPVWVRGMLTDARYAPDVARLIMPPPTGTPKNWAAYRERFVEPRRVRAGLAFWRDNEAWLQLAEERYGVPAQIIVGIVGVETLYGAHMGRFRVLDALATLAFDFPAGRRDRSAFFRDELEQFLMLCYREGADPRTLAGSYAGAIGMPQFMPSSINAHAVDFDGNGRIDLHASAADVIGSVANYLAKAGWQSELPTHFEVTPPADPSHRATLLGPDIVPLFSPQEFAELGASLGDPAMGIAGKLALVELHNGHDAPSYVAGTTNFYAITRYNWSSYYAMAVIALGEAVRQQR